MRGASTAAGFRQPTGVGRPRGCSALCKSRGRGLHFSFSFGKCAQFTGGLLVRLMAHACRLCGAGIHFRARTRRFDSPLLGRAPLARGKGLVMFGRQPFADPVELGLHRGDPRGRCGLQRLLCGEQGQRALGLVALAASARQRRPARTDLCGKARLQRGLRFIVGCGPFACCDCCRLFSRLPGLESHEGFLQYLLALKGGGGEAALLGRVLLGDTARVLFSMEASCRRFAQRFFGGQPFKGAGLFLCVQARALGSLGGRALGRARCGLRFAAGKFLGVESRVDCGPGPGFGHKPLPGFLGKPRFRRRQCLCLLGGFPLGLQL